MSRMPALLAIALVLVLALAGCTAQEPEFEAEDQLPAELREDDEPTEPGDDGDDEPTGDVHQFVAVDIDFSDAPTEIAAGTVTFELVNEGAILHNVAIEELGNDIVVEANGGETATGNVTLDPGDYTYFCSVPGHRAAGMEGELTVS